MVFDIIVLVALLISAGIAFFRGFIREILTILGVAGGLAAAWGAGPLCAPLTRSWLGVEEGKAPEKLFGMIPYPIVADALAYGGIFILVVILLSITSHFLSGWAKKTGLGAVDRSLGALFGIARGVIVLALLYLPVSVLFDRPTLDEWFKDSRTRFYIAATADGMMKLLPESFREDSGEKAEAAADGLIRSTRDTLRDMDVLRDQKQTPEDTDPASAPEQKKGYEREQRRQMNNLFEDNFNE